MTNKKNYIEEQFCIVPDWIIKKYKGKPICFVYGKIYSYCQMYLGACTASQGNIAEQLGVSRKTVYTACQKLLADGLIEDVTPEDKDKTGYTRYFRIKNQENSISPDTTITETVVNPDTSVDFTQVDSETTQEVSKNYTPPVTNLHRGCVKTTHKYIDNISNNININIEEKSNNQKFTDEFGVVLDWKGSTIPEENWPYWYKPSIDKFYELTPELKANCYKYFERCKRTLKVTELEPQQTISLIKDFVKSQDL